MFWASHTLPHSMQWTSNWEVWIIMLLSTKRFGNSLGLCFPVFGPGKIHELRQEGSWLVCFFLQCLSSLMSGAKRSPSWRGVVGFQALPWACVHVLCVLEGSLGPKTVSSRCLIKVCWVNKCTEACKCVFCVSTVLKEAGASSDFLEPAGDCH